MHPIPEGRLLAEARRVAEAARRSGALETLPTRSDALEEGGTRFLLRELAHLELKRRIPKTPHNPFLPPDPALTVGSLGETHLCVLNKFNVVDLHLLFVTRVFEDQQERLTPDDAAALCRGLREIDGLAFYNSGPAAGASQPHRHLQLVPAPLGEGPGRFPLEAFYRQGLRERARPSARGGFLHLLARTPPLGEAGALHALYESLLAEAGLGVPRPGPYNLLVTRELCILVPRSRESAAGLSVNALGFAGSLFVGRPSEREQLAAMGPWALLRDVGRQEQGP